MAVSSSGSGRGRDKGASARLRAGARMRGDFGEVHIEFCGRYEPFGADANLPEAGGGLDMGAYEPVGVVDRSCGHYGRGPVRAFLRRLEDELQLPAQLRKVRGRPARKDNALGRVGIVQACMMPGRPQPEGRRPVRQLSITFSSAAGSRASSGRSESTIMSLSLVLAPEASPPRTAPCFFESPTEPG